MAVKEDIATVVAEEIAGAAGYLGVAAHTASDLANQVADRIRLRIGGFDLYQPKLDRGARAERIRRDFTGDNIDELAKREHLTPRRVRQILAERK